MKANGLGHLSDEALAALDDESGRDTSGAAEHVRFCDMCRRRRDELTGLRRVLARTRERELSPRRDVVPGALKRLRLRRNAVTNVNELFGSIYALMRGIASLLSAGEAGDSRPSRNRSTEDDAHG